MKNKHKTIFNVLISLTVCLGIIFTLLLLLVPAEIGGDDIPAGDSVSGIPYSSPLPDNRAILVLGERGEGALVCLDFENIVINTYLYEENAEEEAKTLGYIIDYTMEIDNNFLSSLCDRIGGIELETNGETLRYFGSSLNQILASKPDYNTMYSLSSAFFEKFAKIGLSSYDFMYIIENTNTNLNFPTCYDWLEFMGEMVCNCVFH